MRFVRLLRWDMRFQARYGFYLLYGFLTTFYTLILFALPEVWKEKMAAILIFSDPAAMGLFFMGAIILLEKNQKVTSYFAITPLKTRNYVWSKVLSLCAISLAVAAVLGIIADHKHILLLLAGTFLASVIFTLCGIIVATKISSLNQFILFIVPIGYDVIAENEIITNEGKIVQRYWRQELLFTPKCLKVRVHRRR